MNLSDLIDRVKRHPEYKKVGMILAHNGVVRATSRAGRPVTGLRVEVDRERLDAVLREAREMPGIVDVQIHIEADRDLAVGDDVMYLVAAGDIRENVIACLAKTLDAVKSTVTRKTEFFAGL